MTEMALAMEIVPNRPRKCGIVQIILKSESGFHEVKEQSKNGRISRKNSPWAFPTFSHSPMLLHTSENAPRECVLNVP